MRLFLPSQSVNDIRFIDGDGSALITFGPGTTVASLSNSPAAMVWTAPV
jgi:hypothetical protein